MIIRQNTNAIQQLLDMKELLSDPTHWAKGAWAYGKDAGAPYEYETSPHDPNAVSWCLMGAGLYCSDINLNKPNLINYVKEHQELVSYPFLLEAAQWFWADERSVADPFEVNDDDHVKHEHIIKLINYALALATADACGQQIQLKAPINEPVEDDMGPLEGAEYEERVEEPVCV